VKSHINYVVADTKTWEESAAYLIDTNDAVDAFAKNAGLGFAIPYFYNGEAHDYIPDFIVRLKTEPPLHLIIEVKGTTNARILRRKPRRSGLMRSVQTGLTDDGRM
jgi:type III restriction enzyme